MLNKSHPLSRYKANSGKNKKKMTNWVHDFDKGICVSDNCCYEND